MFVYLSDTTLPVTLMLTLVHYQPPAYLAAEVNVLSVLRGYWFPRSL